MLCKIKTCLFVKIGWQTESSYKMSTMHLCLENSSFYAICEYSPEIFSRSQSVPCVHSFLSSCKLKCVFLSACTWRTNEGFLLQNKRYIQDTCIMSIFIPFSTIKQHVDPINAMLSGNQVKGDLSQGHTIRVIRKHVLSFGGLPKKIKEEILRFILF